MDVRFDAEAYAARRGVLNAHGGRGFDRGVRVVPCPWCRDAEGHAWVNVQNWRAGCFKPHCPAHEGRTFFEYVAQAEGLASRWEAVRWLEQAFPGATALRQAAVPERQEDWVVWPRGVRWFGAAEPGVLHAEAVAFLRRQWGLTEDAAAAWGWGYCTEGRFAWRIVIPVVMGGVAVQFQARSYRRGEPKYLSGMVGTDAARGMESCLYNLDALREEGDDAVLVEGAADVAGWEDRRDGARSSDPDGRGGYGDDQPRGVAGHVGDGAGGGAEHDAAGVDDGRVVAVGLLGSALTGAKAALLAARRPGTVTVALDRDAQRASVAVADALRAWGIQAEVGIWLGGKDAGSGACLVRVAADRARRGP